MNDRNKTNWHLLHLLLTNLCLVDIWSGCCLLMRLARMGDFEKSQFRVCMSCTERQCVAFSWSLSVIGCDRMTVHLSSMMRKKPCKVHASLTEYTSAVLRFRRKYGQTVKQPHEETEADGKTCHVWKSNTNVARFDPEGPGFLRKWFHTFIWSVDYFQDKKSLITFLDNNKIPQASTSQWPEPLLAFHTVYQAKIKAELCSDNVELL